MRSLAACLIAIALIAPVGCGSRETPPRALTTDPDATADSLAGFDVSTKDGADADADGSSEVSDGDADASDIAEAETDGAPKPEVIASGQPGPRAIAVDDAHVYWSCLGGGKGGSIRRSDLAGGSFTVLAADSTYYPAYMQRVSGGIYFTSFAAGSSPTRILRLLDTETTPFELVSTGVAQEDVAIGGASLFFGASTSTGGVSNLVSMPLSGGTVSTLATGATSPLSPKFGAGIVYWNGPLGDVMTMSASGGPSAVLAAGQSPLAIALSGSFLYMTSKAGTEVRRVAVTGGSVEVLATGMTRAIDLAVDGTTAFWVDTGVDSTSKDGRVMSVVPGGSPITIASGQKFPTGIAVGKTHVYWTTDDAVMRMAR